MSAQRPHLKRAALVLTAIAALALCAAGVLDLWAGTEVTLLHNVKQEQEQDEWRRLRDPRDDPAEIYGQPDGAPLRVLVFDAARLIAPPEAPQRRLLRVDRAAGDVPLQTRTLWRYALTLALPALLLALVLALVLGRMARR